MLTRRNFIVTLAASSLALRAKGATIPATRVRSARSGPWSSASTWEGGQIPAIGAVVEIRQGHEVVYDVKSDRAIRMVHILGKLTFARDRDTRLDVGLLKIGGDAKENGADCTTHTYSGPRPTLEVGNMDQPIPAKHTALIRLTYFDGFDRDSLPAIMCCGGRMDFHGAPLNRTWVKLGAPVKKGDTEITLSEPVTGWRKGDRILLTATTRQIIIEDTFRETTRDNTQTEELILQSVGDGKLVLEQPAQYDHICDGPYRGDVANLSRNVIVESADPKVERGHTMYHHNSRGSISYAEFRQLGKQGVLGRYSIHFHQVRDTMRGSSVIGVSVWDSGNRWITVHGTDYLVVRDVVGYNSIGHGYFLEDGTEVFNIFDRNLGVQGRTGAVLPKQVLPFDHNSGSAFWWANSLNTFTRNVACECDVYGFRFDMQKTKTFDPVVFTPKTDGSLRQVDARTLPFVQFEDNESHCQRNHAFNLGGLDINLGGNCGGIGPDAEHPFVVRNMRVWNSHWAFHPMSPSLLVDNFDIHNTAYGLWKPRFDKHVYRNIHMENIAQEVILDATGTLPNGIPSATIGPAKVYDLNTTGADFPKPLEPVDDLPPIVVATYVGKSADGKIAVRGSASDVGPIKSIQINGHDVRAVRPQFAEWEVLLPATEHNLTIRAEDAAGNVSSVKLA